MIVQIGSDNIVKNIRRVKVDQLLNKEPNPFQCTVISFPNILPKELEQGWDLEDAGIAWFRDGDNFGLQIEDVGIQSNFYAYARRMQHITLDFDPTYPGEDKILTPSNPNNDDGRFLLRGYESIPFRIEDGSDMYVQGDNFSL